MPKIVLSKEDGRMVVYGYHEDYETISEEIYDQSRWSIHKTGVFKRLSDGTFWMADWSEGATEYQDKKPFEYNDAEFFQVEPKGVTVTKYVFVED